jgi:DNA primase
MTAAQKIARALGPARRSGGWWRTVCPVHGSRTGCSLSLALRDTDRGLALHCHAGCARADIMAELRRRGLLARLEDRPPPTPAARADDSARNVEIARLTWRAGRDARGSPVARYLADRGLTLPVPPGLRYAPSLRRPDGTYGPAMVARIDNIDAELIGIHRTWLDRDAAGVWRRRDRAMLGPVRGGAARLGPPAAALMVAEGIETTLAAMQATGTPGWAAGSTSGLMALRLPPLVRDVLIAVDRDASGAGERSARTAGRKWLVEGRRVRLIIPHTIGADVADLIADARHAA